MEDRKKYLDLIGLIDYDKKLKAYIDEIFSQHSHTLTFGKYEYNGTEDVNVDIYEGKYEE